MDRNEYRKRLEELVVVIDRKPSKSPQHNRLAKEIVIEIDELTGEEIEVEREVTENITLGFDIKLKDRVAVCELGCGDVVTNQIIEKRYGQTPKPHWKIRCRNCDCYVSPEGAGFIKGGHQIQYAYMRYFNEVKSNKKTIQAEVSSGPTRITEYNDHTEIITNNNIIRRYK